MTPGGEVGILAVESNPLDRKVVIRFKKIHVRAHIDFGVRPVIFRRGGRGQSVDLSGLVYELGSVRVNRPGPECDVEALCLVGVGVGEGAAEAVMKRGSFPSRILSPISTCAKGHFLYSSRL